MKSHVLALGNLQFDLKTKEVSSTDGSPAELRKKSKDVLALLAERAGETVSKDTIMETVWPDVVVTGESIVQCVAEIRRLIGEDAKKVLLTVPREGYRLSPAEPEASARKHIARFTTAAALAALAAIAVGFFWLAPVKRSGPPVIAVLPLDDLSLGDNKGVLGDMLSEGIITDLARFPQLKIIAKNTSFQFRDGQSIDEIERSLNVDYVIGGSQLYDGTSLRVSYYIIDTASRTHVYSDRIERPLGDVFSMQDDVVRRIVAVSGERIMDHAPRRRGPDYASAHMINLEAYRIMTSHYSKENFDKAYALQTGSIARYPEAPWGHIGLALLLRSAALWEWLDEPRDTLLDRAEFHAETAISLDRDNYLAHYARARVHSERGETEESIKRFETAIALNPSDSDVLIGYSVPLLYIGRNERALDILKQAKDIDPLHRDWLYWQQGWAYWQTNECTKGVDAMKSMAKPPVTSQRMLAGLYACLGDKENAQAALKVWLDVRPDYTMADEIRSHATSKWKVPGAIERWIDDMRFAGVPET